MTEQEAQLASPLLRRVWMLGAWDSGVGGDADAFKTLVGKTPAEAADDLIGLSTGIAPVFAHVGSAWRLIDTAATFGSLAKDVTQSDLQGLELVMQQVLGAVDPRLDLPRQDRWRANLDGKARAHSSDLRKGLARTLAVFGASERDDETSSTVSLSGWSELIVRALLQRANEDPTGKLWESLFDVLSILAEAAPDVFIDALSVAIGSEGVLTDKLFTDDDTGIFSQTSPHTYVLWALERIAWSPEHFGAVMRQMKRLATLDPGGKTANRPLASLAGVLSSWHPQTGATLKSRITVLRAIAGKGSDLDWKILLALTPDSHAWAIDSGGPEFRDWKSNAEARKVTMQDLFEFVTEVVNLSIQAAEQLPVRYADLIEKLDDMPAEHRDKILDSLRGIRDEAVTEEMRDIVWNRLGELIRRHREFADADWSLPARDLDGLEELRNHFVPSSPVPKVAWLFSAMPELGNVKYTDDHEAYQTELARLRLDAITQVIEVEGKSGLTELAGLADAPHTVGYSAASSGLLDDELEHFAALMVDESAKVVSFSSAFVGVLLSVELIAKWRCSVIAPWR
ncbi:hypothetical protein NVV95_09000 [Herbiconiux sp. CPCC 205716]|uniref:Uncharacterized protein n=1 Tax=Herbiconiux gentiana TaxID=2970912 RepID=A0ABT2GEN4_9MICO|nr:hypothetical protein [Herbiconiux gentiana]MCS5714688.1 hypothetical protein [Herbiconiux gentiana]